jgi:hypothetical protein
LSDVFGSCCRFTYRFDGGESCRLIFLLQRFFNVYWGVLPCEVLELLSEAITEQAFWRHFYGPGNFTGLVCQVVKLHRRRERVSGMLSYRLKGF